MRNAFLVAWREYAENIRTKGFWIGILMLPLILLAAVQIPVFLETKAKPSRYFVLADYTGELEGVVMGALEVQYQREVLQGLKRYARENVAAGSEAEQAPGRFADESPAGIKRFIEEGGAAGYLELLRPHLKDGAAEFELPRRVFERVPTPVELGTDPEALASGLRPFLRGEKKVEFKGAGVALDSAIILPPRILERRVNENQQESPPGMQYWAVNLADKSLRNLVENAVNEERQRREYLQRGMDPRIFLEIEGMRVRVEEWNPKKAEGEERVSQADKITQWAPVGFVYLLWIAIFSISQMLLNNTIEEKSNRIIEVLLSSVTPAEFVLGKLAGIAGVGLTMVGAWVGSMLAVVFWKAEQSGMADTILGVLAGSYLLPAFIVYFVFGYLLYAALILAIGSVCNTLKEAQNYMAVITMLMMVPLMTMMFIPKDPHGTLATVLSWIPLYTPFVMMNRAAAHPPMFDLIGTMVLLAGTTAAAFWVAVKIFRVGVLRTGQPPRLMEIIRWLKP